MAYGKLAQEFCDVQLQNRVLKSGAGYYIGTFDYDPLSSTFGPCSCESVEYWSTEAQAEEALFSGEWTQRTEP